MDDGRPDERLIALRTSRPSRGLNAVPPPLDLLLDAAQEFVHETHIGISVIADSGAVATLAATDPLVFVLDQVQHDIGDGPSLTAIRGQHTVIVDDSVKDRRWSLFMSRAADVGVRSVLAVPLALHGDVLGGLTLYSRTLNHVTAQTLTHTTEFAAQAAIIVAQAQREKDLLMALQSSSTISKATGLVMERFCIDDQEALSYLRHLATSGGIGVVEVAAHLVDQSNTLWRLTEAERTLPTATMRGLTLVRSSDPHDDHA